MFDRTTVVVATHNRRESLAESLVHHQAPVILVDNGSADGTPQFVRTHFPEVQLIELKHNVGASARNIGVRAACTPFVAFADDDSWWASGALAQAESIFDEYPRLGLIAASVLVGVDERLDPASALMANSPLGCSPDLPGPSVLGFLACGAILRRTAFLAAGGFDRVVFFAGEEERLAMDLMAAGWGLSYVGAIAAHHHPAGGRDPVARRQLEIRNMLLTSVMRRPWSVVGHQTWRALRGGADGRRASLAAMRRAPSAVRLRKRLPQSVEQSRKLLDGL